MRLSPARATRRAVLALDAVVVAWVAACIAIGIWVAIDVHDLGRLADTLGSAAAAIGSVSKAIDSLSGVPFVGGSLRHLAGQGTATAHSAAVNAVSTKASIDQLAYLLGFVIALVPTVPALAGYLPFRFNRARERRAVRHALRASKDLGPLRRYLAERALANLPYHRLTTVSPTPWEDYDRGEIDALAGAELRRLGFDHDLLARFDGSARGASALSGRSVP